jgi:PAP2 superfamily protein
VLSVLRRVVAAGARGAEPRACGPAGPDAILGRFVSSNAVLVGRRDAASRTGTPPLRLVLSPPLVAAISVVLGIIATNAAGFRFRDPDNVAAGYVGMVGAAIVVLVGLDVYVRAARAAGTWRPPRAALREVRRVRWTRGRMAAAFLGLLSFYVAYLAFRNLKGALPILRPRLTDAGLADADRWLFLGHDPATLLHGAFGTGWLPANVFSSVYVAFIVFLPLSLAVALVFARDLPTSLFFATALSANWLLGIGSYYLLPSLGPCYADPGLFASLAHMKAATLQDQLMVDRIGFLRDPDHGIPQAIAAFASLHIGMSFSSLLMAHLLHLGRALRVALWVWLAATFLATVYLGWHYVVDDLAGLVIGALGLLMAALVSGYDPRTARRSTTA